MKVRFADFTFDTISGQLRRGDRRIPLLGTASELLRVLLEERPQIVTKEELLQRVWRGAAVEEGSVSVYIAKVREALGDDPRVPRFIRTHHRTGYAFIADAAEMEPAGHDRSSAGSAFLLECDGRRLALSEGENMIGRNPLVCSVCIDDERVSRTHARIIVSGDTATIEDLNSVNHTFIGRTQITSRQPLTEGDVIRLGGPKLRFRRLDVATVKVKERLVSR